MNTIPLPTRARELGPLQPHTDDYLDLGLVFRAAKRQALLVIAMVTVCAGLALAYALSLPQLFTSHASILLDEDRRELLELISDLPSAAFRDATVQSEVEVIKSQELALKVVDQLDLVDRRSELSVRRSPVDLAINSAKNFVLGFVAPEQPRSASGGTPDPAAREERLRQETARRLRSNLTVRRVSRSFVLMLSYEAPSPGLAREILDAYTREYLAFGPASNEAASEEAVAWLRERTGELRERALQANRDLERYRSEHGLISVGSVLLSEQQLRELTSQLILAQADEARAQAVAQQARAAANAGPETSIVSLTAHDGGGEGALSARLKDEFVNQSRQYRNVVERFGADHPEAQRLALALADTRTEIAQEVGRVAARAENEAAVATSRVEAIREGLTTALSQTAADMERRYRVAQLEQTQQSYKALYQSSLTRLERTMQQTQLPIVPARVLTAPDQPRDASSPSKFKFTALGIVLGGLIGGGIGLARELSRNTLAGREDALRLTGLPLIASHGRAPRFTLLSRGGKKESLPRALRAVKFALDASQRGSPRSIAFIAPRSGSGTTLLASRFAAMLANHGLSTLLIDAHPGHRSTSDHFDVADAPSLVDRLRDPDMDEPLDEVEPGLFVVPAAAPDAPDEASVLAQSAQMGRLLDTLYSDVDYVVFDLPPASNGPDALAFLAHTGAVVVVNRRGGANAVRDLVEMPEVSAKALGLVLNKA